MDKIQNIKKLSESIDNAIINVDQSLSVKDLAIAVSIVLKDSYGKHNFTPFLKELKKNLKTEEDKTFKYEFSFHKETMKALNDLKL